MHKILVFFIALVLTFSLSCKKRKGCTNECASNYSNAKNDDGSCEFVKPIIDYTSHFVNNCKPPYGVNFYTNVNNVSCKVKYEWNFGDGTTSLEQYPYHIYTTSGTYSVTAKAINETEETTKTFTVILDTLQSLVSQFNVSSNNDNYHIPAKVNFTNYSQFAGTFLWDFGDGTTSNSIAPSHIYTTAGTYTVSLKSSCGLKEANYTKTVTILPKPVLIALTQLRVTKGAQVLSSDKGTPLYMEMQYDNTNRMFSQIFLYKSYPVSWTFPNDIFSGSYKVTDAFLSADFLTFRVWLDEITATDRLLQSVNVDYKFLTDNYFPKKVIWNSNEYGVEATLDYQ